MTTQIEPRIEVGTSSLGSVFIFHSLSPDAGESWMVKAGNHTLGSFGTETEANALAMALVGPNTAPGQEAGPEQPVVETAPEPVVEPEPEVPAEESTAMPEADEPESAE